MRIRRPADQEDFVPHDGYRQFCSSECTAAKRSWVLADSA